MLLENVLLFNTLYSFYNYISFNNTDICKIQLHIFNNFY